VRIEPPFLRGVVETEASARDGIAIAAQIAAPASRSPSMPRVAPVRPARQKACRRTGLHGPQAMAHRPPPASGQAIRESVIGTSPWVDLRSSSPRTVENTHYRGVTFVHGKNLSVK
jgi:hypothetical protein